MNEEVIMLEVSKCIKNETVHDIDARQMNKLFKLCKLKYVKPILSILRAVSTVKATLGSGIDGGTFHS